MACSDFASYADFWTAGQFMDAILCPYQDLMGGALFALMVFGGLGLALYIYSGSIVLPLVLAILLGSIVVAQLPGVGIQVAGIVLILGGTVAFYLLIQRVQDRP